MSESQIKDHLESPDLTTNVSEAVRQRLSACLASDPHHITPGQKGEYVKAIQDALKKIGQKFPNLGLLPITDPAGEYGSSTVATVLKYKGINGIVRSGQPLDNIVGRMTITQMDNDLLFAPNLGPPDIMVTAPGRIVSLIPTVIVPSYIQNLARANVVDGNIFIMQKNSRWPPGIVSTITCAQTGNVAVAKCTNYPDSIGGYSRLRKPITFLSELSQVSNMAALSLNPADGGTVQLTVDPHSMRFETFRPGDADVVVTRGNIMRSLHVCVRAEAKGPVNRPPLTKLTAGSRFFSASPSEGGEYDPAGPMLGRPVNPKRGGRLINLGGETETPEFEDYQVDLENSQSWTDPSFFRPWADDLGDSSIYIPSQSASHITMRGAPFTDVFARVIRRIAQPNCRFTFCGAASDKSKLPPGRELESFITTGMLCVAMELN